MNELIIELKEFPTHLPYTKNKIAPNKFVKINNQTIYNGKINRHSRAILMENLHKYIMNNLPNTKITKFPVTVTIDIHTVINHGDIQRRLKGGIPTILYPDIKEGYKPGWDLENLSAIWRKAINDSLTLKGIIPDDNITFITSNKDNLILVDDAKNRKIVITIKSIT
jgi:hypothetical protein